MHDTTFIHPRKNALEQFQPPLMLRVGSMQPRAMKHPRPPPRRLANGRKPFVTLA